MINPLIIWLFLTAICIPQYRADVCDLCQCKPNDGKLLIECIGGTKNNIPLELENIQWPTGSGNVMAFFEYLNYTYLPKVLGSATVTSIVLDNNQIDTISTDPFQYFPNIASISIGKNSLQSLPKDFLKSTKKLRSLTLSDNYLSNIDNHSLLHLKNLTELNLSFNRLTTLPKEIMELKSLKHLLLAGNLIFVVENTADDISTQSDITHLNLSKNKFTMISSTSFKNFQQLERLHLGQNEITNIEQEAFEILSQLRHLDLSRNRIEELSLRLPDTLQELDLSFNRLHSWPTYNMPPNLQRLHIDYNNLVSLWNAKLTADRLQFLNASHNAIEQMPIGELHELTTLDLSNNYFNHVPRDLGDLTPKLETLILDENPIEIIEFLGQSTITLQRLSLRKMPLLQIIGRNALTNVDVHENGSCIELAISDCPMLERIDVHAFAGIPFCKLDLSNNNLTTLSVNLTDWTSIADGIDLQGNPFVCNCTTQWMLDKVLNYLYKTPAHQKYLKDLRCDKPYPFTGHRFIKYFRRKAAFCRPSAAITMRKDDANTALANDNESIDSQFPEILRGESGVLIIVIASMVMLLILIGVCLLIIRNRKRKQNKKNRRYPLY